MRSLSILCAGAILLLLSSSAFSQNTTKPASGQKIVLKDLKAIPDGNYLVTLEVNGQTKRFNLRVDANNGKVVKSSDPAMNDVHASFRPYDKEGRFLVRLEGGNYFQNQLWIMRPDGRAAIREAPDRGEFQSAVPVKDDSIEPAAAKP